MDMFLQNVDVIISPGELLVYPEHLTEGLECELTLAFC
jgi:hypothetical protein